MCENLLKLKYYIIGYHCKILLLISMAFRCHENSENEALLKGSGTGEISLMASAQVEPWRTEDVSSGKRRHCGNEIHSGASTAWKGRSVIDHRISDLEKILTVSSPATLFKN